MMSLNKKGTVRQVGLVQTAHAGAGAAQEESSDERIRAWQLNVAYETEMLKSLSVPSSSRTTEQGKRAKGPYSRNSAPRPQARHVGVRFQMPVWPKDVDAYQQQENSTPCLCGPRGCLACRYWSHLSSQLDTTLFDASEQREDYYSALARGALNDQKTQPRGLHAKTARNMAYLNNTRCDLCAFYADSPISCPCESLRTLSDDQLLAVSGAVSQMAQRNAPKGYFRDMEDPEPLVSTGILAELCERRLWWGVDQNTEDTGPGWIKRNHCYGGGYWFLGTSSIDWNAVRGHDGVTYTYERVEEAVEVEGKASSDDDVLAWVPERANLTPTTNNVDWNAVRDRNTGNLTRLNGDVVDEGQHEEEDPSRDATISLGTDEA